MIAQTLQQKIGQAMKDHNVVLVSTLRMLSSAFSYEKISKQHELSQDEELAVIAREVKKRKEAIEAYRSAGSKDKAKLEEDEMKILQQFLPEQISDDELGKIIEEKIKDLEAKGMSDMGKVIGAVKSEVGTKAEGSKIAELVKSKLI